MEPIQAQMVFCCAEQWMGGLFHHIEPWGDGLRLGGTGAVTGAASAFLIRQIPPPRN